MSRTAIQQTKKATWLTAVKQLVLLPVRLYQLLISPLLGQRCRFYPSCSAYCEQAVETHGVLKGLYLSSIRLLKCNPLHAGGCDPVPTRREG